MPLLLAGVLAYLRTTGRYYRRFPMSAEVRQVLAAGFMALLGHAVPGILVQDVGVPGGGLRHLVAVPDPGDAGARTGQDGRCGAAGLWTIPTLIVGNGELGQRCARTLNADRALGYAVVAQTGSLSELDGRNGGLHRIMAQCGATFVVIATDNGVSPANAVVDALVRDNVALRHLAAAARAAGGAERVQLLPQPRRGPAVVSQQPDAAGGAGLEGSAFDLSVALFLLLLTSPVLIAAGLGGACGWAARPCTATPGWARTDGGSAA